MLGEIWRRSRVLSLCSIDTICGYDASRLFLSFFVLILGDAFFFGDSESGCFLYSFFLYCLLNDDGGGGS